MNKIKVFFAFLLATGIIPLNTGCDSDNDDIETKVITEEVIFVSGDILRLMGRVLTLADESSDDHGFLIDNSIDFTTPIEISLGARSKPGRFIGEANGLSHDTKYYCRSYIKNEDGVVLGNVIEVNTLDPQIIDFAPKVALSGSEMTISGMNFSEDTKVFIGEEEVEIDELNFESEIKITVPPLKDEYLVPVKVTSQNKSLQFEAKFEYVIGKWDKVVDFPENSEYFETVAFESDGSLFYGLGRDVLKQNINKFWKLDFGTLIWSEFNFNGQSARDAFAAGNYIGSGAISFTGGKVYSDKFYKYSGGNFISLGTLPFRLYQSVALKLDNTLIVMGGSTESQSNNMNVYAFDELNNEWSIITETPFEIDKSIMSFAHDQSIYSVDYEGHVWKYELETNSWEVVTTFPATVRKNGISQVIGDFAYLGLFDGDGRVWELDLNNLKWQAKIAYPGSTQDQNAAVVVYDDSIYILKRKFSFASEPKPMELWQFSPNKF